MGEKNRANLGTGSTPLPPLSVHRLHCRDLEPIWGQETPVVESEPSQSLGKGGNACESRREL